MLLPQKQVVYLFVATVLNIGAGACKQRRDNSEVASASGEAKFKSLRDNFGRAQIINQSNTTLRSDTIWKCKETSANGNDNVSFEYTAKLMKPTERGQGLYQFIHRDGQGDNYVEKLAAASMAGDTDLISISEFINLKGKPIEPANFGDYGVRPQAPAVSAVVRAYRIWSNGGPTQILIEDSFSNGSPFPTSDAPISRGTSLNLPTFLRKTVFVRNYTVCTKN